MLSTHKPDPTPTLRLIPSLTSTFRSPSGRELQLSDYLCPPWMSEHHIIEENTPEKASADIAPAARRRHIQREVCARAHGANECIFINSRRAHPRSLPLNAYVHTHKAPLRRCVLALRRCLRRRRSTSAICKHSCTTTLSRCYSFPRLRMQGLWCIRADQINDFDIGFIYIYMDLQTNFLSMLLFKINCNNRRA